LGLNCEKAKETIGVGRNSNHQALSEGKPG